MNQKRYITIILIVLVVVLIGIAGYLMLVKKPVPLATTNTSETSNDLWSIFDKATFALKNKNVEAFNAASYTQVSPTDVSLFTQIASTNYDINIKINKDSYINKWQDDKQVIYSTDPIKDDDNSTYGYMQGQVMFIKKDGLWKVLLVSPSIGWGVGKEHITAEEAEQKLQAQMLDSDKDGITDENEMCTEIKARFTECVKTDPNNRDTNGNDWWDGIEAQMK